MARQRERRPILAEWARSGRALLAAVRHQSKDAGYVAAYHGVRLPKYAAKAVAWAPVGAVRGIGRAVRWASAEEGNWHLRQAAADARRRRDLAEARRPPAAPDRVAVVGPRRRHRVHREPASIVLAAGPPWWRRLRWRAWWCRWLATRRAPGGQADHRPGDRGHAATAS